MSDNVEITEGANATPAGGTIVAADEVGGAQYQRVKVVLGADGAVDMDIDSGQQTKENSVPVTLASDQGDLPITLDSEAVVLDDSTASIGYVILQDPLDATRLAEFDNKFKIPIVIDVAHHEIHEGEAYKMDHIQQDDYALCFKIPSGTTRMHMILNWLAESKAEIKLYEGREWDASTGTINTTPIYNRDRNSNNTSQVQEDTGGSFAANMAVILDPSNIGSGSNAAGTEIHHWETWSDKKQTTQSRETSEFILKNNEVYVVDVNSNDGVKDIHILLDWYEHTDE